MDHLSDISAIRGILEQLEPSPDSFLRWIQPQMTPAMLSEIAGADHGFESDLHLDPIRRIHAECRWDAPPDWYPLEVMNLVKWSQPEVEGWAPGTPGTRGHRNRAFCSAALLLVGGDPKEGGIILSENDTLIQLVHSARVLGSDACREAARLIAWRMLHPAFSKEESTWFGLATLLTLAAQAERNWDDDAFDAMCAWIVAEQTRRTEFGCGRRESTAWLLGDYYDLCHDSWLAIARLTLIDRDPGVRASTHTKLEQIGERLLDAHLTWRIESLEYGFPDTQAFAICGLLGACPPFATARAMFEHAGRELPPRTESAYLGALRNHRGKLEVRTLDTADRDWRAWFDTAIKTLASSYARTSGSGLR